MITPYRIENLMYNPQLYKLTMCLPHVHVLSDTGLCTVNEGKSSINKTLYSQIPGVAAYDVWPTLSADIKEKVVIQVAEHLAALFSLRGWFSLLRAVSARFSISAVARYLGRCCI